MAAFAFAYAQNIARLAALVALVPVAAACSRPMTPPAPATAPGASQGATAEGLAPAPRPMPTATSASGTPKRAVAAVPVAEASTVYSQRCALCHGAHGLGDGVAAVNLRPGPRSFADAAWQNSTEDAAIADIIVRGGKAVGRSMMMPPAKDLAAQTELLAGLVAIVRNFGAGGARAPGAAPKAP